MMKIQVVLLTFLLYWSTVSSNSHRGKSSSHVVNDISHVTASGDNVDRKASSLKRDDLRRAPLDETQKSCADANDLNFRETRSVQTASSGTDWGGLFSDVGSKQDPRVRAKRDDKDQKEFLGKWLHNGLALGKQIVDGTIKKMQALVGAVTSKKHGPIKKRDAELPDPAEGKVVQANGSKDLLDWLSEKDAETLDGEAGEVLDDSESKRAGRKRRSLNADSGLSADVLSFNSRGLNKVFKSGQATLAETLNGGVGIREILEHAEAESNAAKALYRKRYKSDLRQNDFNDWFIFGPSFSEDALARKLDGRPRGSHHKAVARKQKRPRKGSLQEHKEHFDDHEDETFRRTTHTLQSTGLKSHGARSELHEEDDDHLDLFKHHSAEQLGGRKIPKLKWKTGLSSVNYADLQLHDDAHEMKDTSTLTHESPKDDDYTLLNEEPLYRMTLGDFHTDDDNDLIMHDNTLHRKHGIFHHNRRSDDDEIDDDMSPMRDKFTIKQARMGSHELHDIKHENDHVLHKGLNFDFGYNFEHGFDKGKKSHHGHDFNLHDTEYSGFKHKSKNIPHKFEYKTPHLNHIGWSSEHGIANKGATKESATHEGYDFGTAGHELIDDDFTLHKVNRKPANKDDSTPAARKRWNAKLKDDVHDESHDDIDDIHIGKHSGIHDSKLKHDKPKHGGLRFGNRKPANKDDSRSATKKRWKANLKGDVHDESHGDIHAGKHSAIHDSKLKQDKPKHGGLRFGNRKPANKDDSTPAARKRWNAKLKDDVHEESHDDIDDIHIGKHSGIHDSKLKHDKPKHGGLGFGSRKRAHKSRDHDAGEYDFENYLDLYGLNSVSDGKAKTRSNARARATSERKSAGHAWNSAKDSDASVQVDAHAVAREDHDKYTGPPDISLHAQSGVNRHGHAAARREGIETKSMSATKTHGGARRKGAGIKAAGVEARKHDSREKSGILFNDDYDVRKYDTGPTAGHDISWNKHAGINDYDYAGESHGDNNLGRLTSGGMHARGKTRNGLTVARWRKGKKIGAPSLDVHEVKNYDISLEKSNGLLGKHVGGKYGEKTEKSQKDVGYKWRQAGRAYNDGDGLEDDGTKGDSRKKNRFETIVGTSADGIESDSYSNALDVLTEKRIGASDYGDIDRFEKASKFKWLSLGETGTADNAVRSDSRKSKKSRTSISRSNARHDEFSDLNDNLSRERTETSDNVSNGKDERRLTWSHLHGEHGETREKSKSKKYKKTKSKISWDYLGTDNDASTKDESSLKERHNKEQKSLEGQTAVSSSTRTKMLKKTNQEDSIGAHDDYDAKDHTGFEHSKNAISKEPNVDINSDESTSEKREDAPQASDDLHDDYNTKDDKDFDHGTNTISKKPNIDIHSGESITKNREDAPQASDDLHDEYNAKDDKDLKHGINAISKKPNIDIHSDESIAEKHEDAPHASRPSNDLHSEEIESHDTGERTDFSKRKLKKTGTQDALRHSQSLEKTSSAEDVDLLNQKLGKNFSGEKPQIHEAQENAENSDHPKDSESAKSETNYALEHKQHEDDTSMEEDQDYGMSLDDIYSDTRRRNYFKPSRRKDVDDGEHIFAWMVSPDSEEESGTKSSHSSGKIEDGEESSHDVEKKRKNTNSAGNKETVSSDADGGTIPKEKKKKGQETGRLNHAIGSQESGEVAASATSTEADAKFRKQYRYPWVKDDHSLQKVGDVHQNEHANDIDHLIKENPPARHYMHNTEEDVQDVKNTAAMRQQDEKTGEDKRKLSAGFIHGEHEDLSATTDALSETQSNTHKRIDYSKLAERDFTSTGSAEGKSGASYENHEKLEHQLRGKKKSATDKSSLFSVSRNESEMSSDDQKTGSSDGSKNAHRAAKKEGEFTTHDLDVGHASDSLENANAHEFSRTSEAKGTHDLSGASKSAHSAEKQEHGVTSHSTADSTSVSRTNFDITGKTKHHGSLASDSKSRHTGKIAIGSTENVSQNLNESVVTESAKAHGFAESRALFGETSKEHGEKAALHHGSSKEYREKAQLDGDETKSLNEKHRHVYFGENDSDVGEEDKTQSALRRNKGHATVASAKSQVKATSSAVHESESSASAGASATSHTSLSGEDKESLDIGSKTKRIKLSSNVEGDDLSSDRSAIFASTSAIGGAVGDSDADINTSANGIDKYRTMENGASANEITESHDAKKTHASKGEKSLEEVDVNGIRKADNIDQTDREVKREKLHSVLDVPDVEREENRSNKERKNLISKTQALDRDSNSGHMPRQKSGLDEKHHHTEAGREEIRKDTLSSEHVNAATAIAKAQAISAVTGSKKLRKADENTEVLGTAVHGEQTAEEQFDAAHEFEATAFANSQTTASAGASDASHKALGVNHDATAVKISKKKKKTGEWHRRHSQKVDSSLTKDGISTRLDSHETGHGMEADKGRSILNKLAANREANAVKITEGKKKTHGLKKKHSQRVDSSLTNNGISTWLVSHEAGHGTETSKRRSKLHKLNKKHKSNSIALADANAIATADIVEVNQLSSSEKGSVTSKSREKLRSDAFTITETDAVANANDKEEIRESLVTSNDKHSMTSQERSSAKNKSKEKNTSVVSSNANSWATADTDIKGGEHKTTEEGINVPGTKGKTTRNGLREDDASKKVTIATAKTSATTGATEGSHESVNEGSKDHATQVDKHEGVMSGFNTGHVSSDASATTSAQAVSIENSQGKSSVAFNPKSNVGLIKRKKHSHKTKELKENNDDTLFTSASSRHGGKASDQWQSSDYSNSRRHKFSKHHGHSTLTAKSIDHSATKERRNKNNIWHHKYNDEASDLSKKAHAHTSANSHTSNGVYSSPLGTSKEDLYEQRDKTRTDSLNEDYLREHSSFNSLDGANENEVGQQRDGLLEENSQSVANDHKSNNPAKGNDPNSLTPLERDSTILLDDARKSRKKGHGKNRGTDKSLLHHRRKVHKSRHKTKARKKKWRKSDMSGKHHNARDRNDEDTDEGYISDKLTERVKSGADLMPDENENGKPLLTIGSPHKKLIKSNGNSHSADGFNSHVGSNEASKDENVLTKGTLRKHGKHLRKHRKPHGKNDNISRLTEKSATQNENLFELIENSWGKNRHEKTSSEHNSNNNRGKLGIVTADEERARSSDINNDLHNDGQNDAKLGSHDHFTHHRPTSDVNSTEMNGNPGSENTMGSNSDGNILNVGHSTFRALASADSGSVANDKTTDAESRDTSDAHHHTNNNASPLVAEENGLTVHKLNNGDAVNTFANEESQATAAADATTNNFVKGHGPDNAVGGSTLNRLNKENIADATASASADANANSGKGIREPSTEGGKSSTLEGNGLGLGMPNVHSSLHENIPPRNSLSDEHSMGDTSKLQSDDALYNDENKQDITSAVTGTEDKSAIDNSAEKSYEISSTAARTDSTARAISDSSQFMADTLLPTDHSRDHVLPNWLSPNTVSSERAKKPTDLKGVEKSKPGITSGESKSHIEDNKPAEEDQSKTNTNSKENNGGKHGRHDDVYGPPLKFDKSKSESEDFDVHKGKSFENASKNDKDKHDIFASLAEINDEHEFHKNTRKNHEAVSAAARAHSTSTSVSDSSHSKEYKVPSTDHTREHIVPSWLSPNVANSKQVGNPSDSGQYEKIEIGTADNISQNLGKDNNANDNLEEEKKGKHGTHGDVGQPTSMFDKNKFLGEDLNVHNGKRFENGLENDKGEHHTSTSLSGINNERTINKNVRKHHEISSATAEADSSSTVAADSSHSEEHKVPLTDRTREHVGPSWLSPKVANSEHTDKSANLNQHKEAKSGIGSDVPQSLPEDEKSTSTEDHSKSSADSKERKKEKKEAHGSSSTFDEHTSNTEDLGHYKKESMESASKENKDKHGASTPLTGIDDKHATDKGARKHHEISSTSAGAHSTSTAVSDSSHFMDDAILPTDHHRDHALPTWLFSKVANSEHLENPADLKQHEKSKSGISNDVPGSLVKDDKSTAADDQPEARANSEDQKEEKHETTNNTHGSTLASNKDQSESEDHHVDKEKSSEGALTSAANGSSAASAGENSIHGQPHDDALTMGHYALRSNDGPVYVPQAITTIATALWNSDFGKEKEGEPSTGTVDVPQPLELIARMGDAGADSNPSEALLKASATATAGARANVINEKDTYSTEEQRNGDGASALHSRDRKTGGRVHDPGKDGRSDTVVGSNNDKTTSNERNGGHSETSDVLSSVGHFDRHENNVNYGQHEHAGATAGSLSDSNNEHGKTNKEFFQEALDYQSLNTIASDGVRATSASDRLSEDGNDLTEELDINARKYGHLSQKEIERRRILKAFDTANAGSSSSNAFAKAENEASVVATSENHSYMEKNKHDGLSSAENRDATTSARLSNLEFEDAGKYKNLPWQDASWTGSNQSGETASAAADATAASASGRSQWQGSSASASGRSQPKGSAASASGRSQRKGSTTSTSRKGQRKGSLASVSRKGQWKGSLEPATALEEENYNVNMNDDGSRASNEQYHKNSMSNFELRNKDDFGHKSGRNKLNIDHDFRNSKILSDGTPFGVEVEARTATDLSSAASKDFTHVGEAEEKGLYSSETQTDSSAFAASKTNINGKKMRKYTKSGALGNSFAAGKETATASTASETASEASATASTASETASEASATASAASETASEASATARAAGAMASEASSTNSEANAIANGASATVSEASATANAQTSSIRHKSEKYGDRLGMSRSTKEKLDQSISNSRSQKKKTSKSKLHQTYLKNGSSKDRSTDSASLKDGLGIGGSAENGHEVNLAAAAVSDSSSFDKATHKGLHVATGESNSMTSTMSKSITSEEGSNEHKLSNVHKDQISETGVSSFDMENGNVGESQTVSNTLSKASSLKVSDERLNNIKNTESLFEHNRGSSKSSSRFDSASQSNSSANLNSEVNSDKKKNRNQTLATAKSAARTLPGKAIPEDIRAKGSSVLDSSSFAKSKSKSKSKKKHKDKSLWKFKDRLNKASASAEAMSRFDGSRSQKNPDVVDTAISEGKNTRNSKKWKHRKKSAKSKSRVKNANHRYDEHGSLTKSSTDTSAASSHSKADASAVTNSHNIDLDSRILTNKNKLGKYGHKKNYAAKEESGAIKSGLLKSGAKEKDINEYVDEKLLEGQPSESSASTAALASAKNGNPGKSSNTFSEAPPVEMIDANANDQAGDRNSHERNQIEKSSKFKSRICEDGKCTGQGNRKSKGSDASATLNNDVITGNEKMDNGKGKELVGVRSNAVASALSKSESNDGKIKDRLSKAGALASAQAAATGDNSKLEIIPLSKNKYVSVLKGINGEGKKSKSKARNGIVRTKHKMYKATKDKAYGLSTDLNHLLSESEYGKNKASVATKANGVSKLNQETEIPEKLSDAVASALSASGTKSKDAFNYDAPNALSMKSQNTPTSDVAASKTANAPEDKNPLGIAAATENPNANASGDEDVHVARGLIGARKTRKDKSRHSSGDRINGAKDLNNNSDTGAFAGDDTTVDSRVKNDHGESLFAPKPTNPARFEENKRGGIHAPRGQSGSSAVSKANDEANFAKDGSKEKYITARIMEDGADQASALASSSAMASARKAQKSKSKGKTKKWKKNVNIAEPSDGGNSRTRNQSDGSFAKAASVANSDADGNKNNYMLPSKRLPNTSEASKFRTHGKYKTPSIDTDGATRTNSPDKLNINTKYPEINNNAISTGGADSGAHRKRIKNLSISEAQNKSKQKTASDSIDEDRAALDFGRKSLRNNKSTKERGKYHGKGRIKDKLTGIAGTGSILNSHEREEDRTTSQHDGGSRTTDKGTLGSVSGNVDSNSHTGHSGAPSATTSKSPLRLNGPKYLSLLGKNSGAIRKPKVRFGKTKKNKAKGSHDENNNPLKSGNNKDSHVKNKGQSQKQDEFGTADIILPRANIIANRYDYATNFRDDKAKQKGIKNKQVNGLKHGTPPFVKPSSIPSNTDLPHKIPDDTFNLVTRLAAPQVQPSKVKTRAGTSDADHPQNSKKPPHLHPPNSGIPHFGNLPDKNIKSAAGKPRKQGTKPTHEGVPSAPGAAKSLSPLFDKDKPKSATHAPIPASALDTTKNDPLKDDVYTAPVVSPSPQPPSKYAKSSKVADTRGVSPDVRNSNAGGKKCPTTADPADPPCETICSQMMDEIKTDIYIVKRMSKGPVKITHMKDSIPPLVTYGFVPREVYERIRNMIAENQIPYSKYPAIPISTT